MISNQNNDSQKLVEFQDEFEDEFSKPIYQPSISKGAKMVKKISGKLIKNEKQANYVLIILAILMISSSFILIFRSKITYKFEPVPVSESEFHEINWPPIQ